MKEFSAFFISVFLAIAGAILLNFSMKDVIPILKNNKKPTNKKRIILIGSIFAVVSVIFSPFIDEIYGLGVFAIGVTAVIYRLIGLRLGLLEKKITKN